MSEPTQETLERMIAGRSSWDEIVSVMRADKEPDRFRKYRAVLQARVRWPERILLPRGDHLSVGQRADGARVVKCDCGHEFADYRTNCKLESLVRVRNTESAISEI